MNTNKKEEPLKSRKTDKISCEACGVSDVSYQKVLKNSSRTKAVYRYTCNCCGHEWSGHDLKTEEHKEDSKAYKQLQGRKQVISNRGPLKD